MIPNPASMEPTEEQRAFWESNYYVGSEYLAALFKLKVFIENVESLSDNLSEVIPSEILAQWRRNISITKESLIKIDDMYCELKQAYLAATDPNFVGGGGGKKPSCQDNFGNIVP